MPALNVTVPQYPGRFDLKDASDSVDRQLESCQAAITMAQQNVRNLAYDPVAHAQYSAGTMPRPSHITSGAGITAYEADVAAALTALTTALAALAKTDLLS